MSARGFKKNLIESNDVLFNISNGLIPNMVSGHKQGISGNIGAGTFEDIWGQNGTMTYPTTAQTVNIKSNSTSDDAGGAGALTIRIFGLDSGYNEITEDITMNGTTNVLSSLLYIRINDMVTLTVGSGGFNAGKITAKNSTDAVIMARMDINHNRTAQIQYTVPNGKKAIFIRGWAGAAKKDDVEFCLMAKEFGGVMTLITQGYVFQSFTVLDFIGGRSFPAKADITIRAKSIGGTVVTTGGYDFILVDV